MSNKHFISGYTDLCLRPPGPMLRMGSLIKGVMIAHFRLSNDISELFPYINAVAENAEYYEKPVFVKFSLDGHMCALYPKNGAAAPFSRRGEARAFIDRMIGYVNDIHARRSSIQPNYRAFRQVSVLDVYKLLPGTNCGKCGVPTCMAFAAAVVKQDATPEQCAEFRRPISENAVYPVYDTRGRLLSTVTISIDTTKTRRELHKRDEHIVALEEKLSRTNRNGGPGPGSETPFLPTPLTDRELEVLRLMAQGATNTEIADMLSISRHTVKSHVVHIFNKLAVNDRTQAAVFAIRHNLV